MPKTTYQLSWEMVGPAELHRFCDANPVFYKNVTQTVPNSQIPDEYWYPVSKVTDDPWDQYNKLKEWDDSDRQFVRNVTLVQAEIADPDWRPVTPPTDTEGGQ